MGDTSISWTDKTWNCIRGCSRVSKGCMNCYAETTARRFGGKGGPYEGLIETRLHVINADEPDKQNRLVARWTGKVDFVPEHLADPLRWREPCRVFVASMSDPFHEKLTNEQIGAMYGVMAAAKKHTFQMLTKRSRRRREWFAWLSEAYPGRELAAIHGMAESMIPTDDDDGRILGHLGMGASWPLPNVWEGVSTEDQDAADDRIPDLLSIPGLAVRFISAEPLLGPIDLEHVQRAFEFELDALAGTHGVLRPHGGRCAKLDWVIAGCESGHRARPCDYRWLRSLRDQCARHGTSFFLKQATEVGTLGAESELEDHSGQPLVHGIDVTMNHPPSAPKYKGHAYKKARVIERPYLDGRQHLEFPR